MKLLFLIPTALFIACSDADVSQTKATGSHTSLLQQILKGSSGLEDEAGWPKPPRVTDSRTHEHLKKDVFPARAIGNLGFVEAGVAVDFIESIRHKISVYVIAQSNKSYVNPIVTKDNPKGLSNDLFHEIEEGVVVANLWDGNRDMVFFCNFSLSQEEANERKARFFVFVGGRFVNTQLTEMVESSTMTSFEKVLPGDNMSTLGDRCEEKYVSKGHYQALLRRIRTNTKNLYFHGKNLTCVQDEHCADFHKDAIPSVVEHTVSRCVFVKEEVSICKRFSTENRACSLNRKFTLPDGSTERVLITPGLFEYPCDRGLQCTADSNPIQLPYNGLFKGLVLKPAKASCKPQVDPAK